ncbi:ULP_PROTEASE domain-containing protein [Trichoderma simmonsii]|uniref:ULP_PROTEASE domain-containing protein n=3 Tax=Trichoderma simmonsii TaxID=1491479 RepID=A0A8G0LRJ7_9HYPO|nr:ULP_PROTEASE domain-containing protein [Trichoderma simmonsii]
MPSAPLLTRIASIERRLNLNNATTTDDAMSLCDDDKPPSVTTAARDDAAGPKTQPLSPSLPKIHIHVQPESVAVGAPKLPESAPSVASRIPIEAVEEKLPDSHEDQGSDRKPTTKPLDAFARYLSDANSFPDYGDRSRRSTMGPERLKQINRLVAKPVNTLSVRRYEGHNEPDVPSAKRQKKDGARPCDSTMSPYFATPRAKKSSEIHDVRVEPDDIYDIRSTSSAGITGANNLSVVEYRNVLPQSRKGGRRRRSRTGLNSSSQQRDSSPGPYRLPTISTKRTLISTISDSPDVLNSEKPFSGVSEIVSDISPLLNVKRERPHRPGDNFGRQFKRQKPSTPKETIDISEDELQADSAKQKAPNERENAISRSSGTAGGLSKNPMRGDIQHTIFGKRSRRPRSEMIAITRAVCGKWIYNRGDRSGAVFLHREGKEGKRLDPVLENGQVSGEHAWLGVDLDQVRSFGVSEVPNRYGFVARSQSGDAGPKLYLEFENHDGIEAFCHALKSVSIPEKFIAELEKRAERAFDEAKSWIASNSPPKYSSLIFARDKRETDTDLAPPNPDGRPGSTRAKLKDNLIQSAKNLNGSDALQRKDNLIQSEAKDLDDSDALRRRDNLIQSTKSLDDSDALQRIEEMLDSDTRRSTRSSAPTTRYRMPSPVGWTQVNPDWHESWQAPLVFPPTGKNRALVDKIDIPRLDENEFLNDNLINFYIRYLEHTLERERPELLRKVYFFSTFFFEKLRSTKGKINYDGVKAWTAKVDLLSYDYIVVPVNEHAHWYLAIICNVPNAIQSTWEGKNSETLTNSMTNAIEVTDTPSSPRLSTVERDLTEISLEDGTAATGKQKEETAEVSRSPPKKRKSAGATSSKFDPSQPRIITLDSLGGPHAPTCKALREYLIEEAKTKKGIELATVPAGMTARGIPEQNNFCDCGVFILGYMQEFLANPDEAARKLLMKEELGWNIRPSEMRNRIRGLLFDLQGEQQEHHKQLEKEKRLRRAKRKSLAPSSPRSSSPVRSVVMSPLVPKLPGAFPSDSPESKPVPETTLSSSESVQETEDSEGRGSNGKASHEAQEKPNTFEEFRFISPLPGSSISPPDTKDKPFVGTSSSFPKLDSRSSRVVVELKSAKGYDKSEFEEPTVLDDDEVQIVKEPYAQKGGSKATETRRRRHSSVEVVEATTSRPTSSSRVQNQENKSSVHTSPRLKPRQSIEYDSDKGSRGEPKYDGIDRSGKSSGQTIL